MKTNFFVICAMLSLVTSGSGFASKASQSPGTAKVAIRSYCFYIPKEKQGLSPAEQVKSAKYVKLTDPTEGKSKKILAESRKHDYAVSEKEYFELFNECERFVGDKGQVLDLKGTNAASYETLTSFSRINISGTDENFDPEAHAREEQIEKDFQAILVEAGISDDEMKSAIEMNPRIIESIASHLGSLAATAKDVAGNEYAAKAMVVAATLAAAWFGPAYLAGAMEFLYPYVYQALFGVPSMWGLAYWTVYYPGKMHAVTWTFNNAAIVIATISGIVSTASEIRKNVTQKDLEKKMNQVEKKLQT